MKKSLKNSCYVVKLSTGDTLITGPMYTNEGMIYFLYPVRINFTSVLYNDDVLTQYIPVLYQPFGNNKYIPIAANHIISILDASDSDIRFYSSSLNKLIIDETKRLLILDAIMNNMDYAVGRIMDPPEMIQ